MAGSSTPFSAARPKRAGDHFTRTRNFDADEPSAKKPRFDPRNPSTLVADVDDEEDPTLAADVIGKRGGIKRNAVNIDGYDSDSSTDNFDVRAADKKKQNARAVDDDDMFADEDDAQGEESRRSEKKKKQLRFLDDHEIEGQEDTSKSGGHVAVDFGIGDNMVTDEAESSDETDDEGRDRLDPGMDEELGAGAKKKHAPRLDAFNMKAEQEEGRFDEAGNYIRKAYDPEAAQDSWLEGISKKEIKKAKEAQEKMLAAQREREKLNDAIVTSDVLSELLTHLKVGETPMDALLRYGKLVPEKKKFSNYSKKKKQDTEVEVDPAVEAAAAQANAAIESITECASRLQNKGLEVYEQQREMIMRLYKRETGKDWKHPNPPEEQWEFHWLAADEEDYHGPYSTSMMRAWDKDNQFAAGAEFRRVGETEWSRLLDLDC